MKRLFIAFLILSPLYATHDPYQWTLAVMHRTTPEEQTLIANLLYWSYARSSSTVEVQQAYLTYLNDCIKTGQDIAATRLNPAHEMPNKCAAATIAANARTYADALSLHQAIQKTYCHCINIVMKPHILSYYPHDRVKALRDAARKVSADAMRSYLPTLNNYLQNTHELADTVQSLLDQYHAPGDRSLLDSIWHWLSPSLMDSFITFEHKTNKLYQVWGSAFYTAHYMNEMLWVTIEQARMSFYSDFYRMFCQQCHYPLYHAFNESGFIPAHERMYVLPAI